MQNPIPSFKRSLLRLSLLALFLLPACGPSPEQQAASTAAAQTSTAAAWTPTPTATATVTPSPTPTSTPTPTLMPTPTIPAETGRFVAPDGSFSLAPPEGWKSSTSELMEYPILTGPTVGLIPVGFTFMEDNITYPMAFYSAIFQDMLTEKFPALETISENFLQTEDGLEYFRWELNITVKGLPLYQIMYFYENGDLKLVVTYSRLQGPESEFDALADEAAKTVRMGE